MRLRNIPGAKEAIADSKYCVQEPETRKFDSSINQKTLTGPIKPVFFCQILVYISVAIYSYMWYNKARRYLL